MRLLRSMQSAHPGSGSRPSRHIHAAALYGANGCGRAPLALRNFVALGQNTTGEHNVATGDDALVSNTEGIGNVATGADALFLNTTGNANVATGQAALFANRTGLDNVALGDGALRGNISGNANVAVGSGALAEVRGRRNIALGTDAGANITGVRSDNIEIGNEGLGSDSATIRIGTQGTQTRAFMAGITDTSIPGPTEAVVVNADGQLGTATAAKAAPLSSADGERLLQLVKRQQRQIERLRDQVKGD